MIQGSVRQAQAERQVYTREDTSYLFGFTCSQGRLLATQDIPL